MEKGYAVKVMMYLSADGRPVRKSCDAQLFADRELAEYAAKLAKGWVAEVVRPRKTVRQPNVKKIKQAIEQPEKQSKCSNQAWMRK